MTGCTVCGYRRSPLRRTTRPCIASSTKSRQCRGGNRSWHMLVAYGSYRSRAPWRRTVGSLQAGRRTAAIWHPCRCAAPPARPLYVPQGAHLRPPRNTRYLIDRPPGRFPFSNRTGRRRLIEDRLRRLRLLVRRQALQIVQVASVQLNVDQCLAGGGLAAAAVPTRAGGSADARSADAGTGESPLETTRGAVAAGSGRIPRYRRARCFPALPRVELTA